MEEMRLRSQKSDIKGRSFILNIACVILNLVGVFLTVKGFHLSSGDSGFILKLIGILLVVASLFGFIMLKGMLLFSFVARALVGGLFIVSGLVKANDPGDLPLN